MNAKIIDLIDFERVNQLLEGFNKSTGFVTAILDLNGNVLSKSGWRQICTEFHRVNTETSKKCTISDTVLAGKLAEGEKYHFYECLNGLVDVAVPIVIKGEHIANLFSGQFFFEEPNGLFFKKQAERYGFDKTKYLNALSQVPVISKEKVKTTMEFLLNMTMMISEMTFQKMEQAELNEELRNSEERWQFAIEGNGDGLWDWNVETNEIFFSKQWKNMLGYGEFEIEDNFNEWKKRVHPDDLQKSLLAIQHYFDNKTDVFSIEHRLRCKSEDYKWIESRGKVISRTPDGKPLRFIGTHTDITNRKEAERNLQESEKVKSDLFEKINETQNIAMIGSWEWNIQSNQVWWSDETYRIYGVDPNDFVPSFEANGKFIHPDDFERYGQAFEHSFQTGEALDYEFRLITRDGQLKYCLAKGKIVYDNSGNAKRFAGTLMDITKRKKDEDLLRESNERLHLILENSPIAIWDWNIKADNWYATPKYHTMLGYEPESGTPDRSTWLSRVHPDDRENVRKRIDNVLDHKTEHYRYDARMLHADGSYRWQTVIGHVIERDTNGEAIRMLGVRMDINETKMAEEALRISEERFSLINDSSRDSIYSYDRNGRFTSVNRNLCKVLNLRPDQIIGRTHAELGFSEKICAEWDDLHRQVYETNNTITSETIAPEGDGSIHYYEVMLNPLHDSDDNIIGIGGSTKDITDRKQAEEEIKNLNKELEQRVKQRTAQLEAANKELETFTYSVSHDLKAPLRGIDGYSKLLLDLYEKSLNEEGQYFLQTIRKSATQMNQLIDDLLEYSRLERSMMKNEEIKIRELINSVSYLFIEEMQETKVALRVDVPDVILRADSKGLNIALRNFFENAIKFTKGISNPEIEIGLEEKANSWILYFKDNGIGFDMKYHQRIFEIFQRLHRAEDYPGTGIGLAMVSKAMQRMNGNAWAESIPGIGSTFYLEIPK